MMKAAEYTNISHGGANFDIPTYHGAHPATVSADATARAREEAEHKAKIREYEVCSGIKQALKDKIIKAIDPDWLEEIKPGQWASQKRLCSR